MILTGFKWCLSGKGQRWGIRAGPPLLDCLFSSLLCLLSGFLVVVIYSSHLCWSSWLENSDLSGGKFHYLGSNFLIRVLNFHICVGLILLGSGHPVMDENGRLPEKFTALRPVQVSFLLGVFLGFLYFQYFCIQYLLPERFSTQVFFLLHFLRLSSFFLSISFHIFCQVVLFSFCSLSYQICFPFEPSNKEGKEILCWLLLPLSLSIKIYIIIYQGC